MKKLEDYVISIPDFPKEGIIFRDVTGITHNGEAFKMAIDGLIEGLKDLDFDLIGGTEARGFVFGAPVAYALGKPFVLFRKPGKLPREVISQEYSLEYGTATIECHKDAIEKGQKVVIIDDLLATGGTVAASAKLVEKLGGEVVKVEFVLELAGLEGRKQFNCPVESLVIYPGK